MELELRLSALNIHFAILLLKQLDKVTPVFPGEQTLNHRFNKGIRTDKKYCLIKRILKQKSRLISESASVAPPLGLEPRTP